ncbi:GPW/gp25 family protein [Serratia rubidaea]|nr:GPW/gp25 family protein [Serratia rubidaea]
MGSSQDNALIRLYGAGWAFPLRFTPPVHHGTATDSTVGMSAGADNVAQSLAMLFQTQPGERIMRPSYGCDLQSAVFMNIAEGALAALRHRIAESVARHEPRAQEVDVDVQADRTQAGTVHIVVNYRLAGLAQQLSGRLSLMDNPDGGSTWAISSL